VGVLLVLITRCQKAVGVIGLRRLGENLLTKARVNRRKEDGVGARNDDILQHPLVKQRALLLMFVNIPSIIQSKGI